MQAGYWFCVLAVHGFLGVSAYLITERISAENTRIIGHDEHAAAEKRPYKETYDSGGMITDMYKMTKPICQYFLLFQLLSN